MSILKKLFTIDITRQLWIWIDLLGLLLLTVLLLLCVVVVWGSRLEQVQGRTCWCRWGTPHGVERVKLQEEGLVWVLGWWGLVGYNRNMWDLGVGWVCLGCWACLGVGRICLGVGRVDLGVDWVGLCAGWVGLGVDWVGLGAGWVGLGVGWVKECAWVESLVSCWRVELVLGWGWALVH